MGDNFFFHEHIYLICVHTYTHVDGVCPYDAVEAHSHVVTRMIFDVVFATVEISHGNLCCFPIRRSDNAEGVLFSVCDSSAMVFPKRFIDTTANHYSVPPQAAIQFSQRSAIFELALLPYSRIFKAI